MENNLLDYWSGIADEHIRNLDKLIQRYENATNENYKKILDQIAKEEKARDHAERMFDKVMQEHMGAAA